MYIVFELQTTGESTTMIPPAPFTDRTAAESDYFIKVGYAAISSVPIHTVMLVSDEGVVIGCKCYKHNGSTPAPEPEQE